MQGVHSRRVTLTVACMAVVIALTSLTVRLPVAGIGVIAVLLLALWAWRRPMPAVCTLAFLSAAFPKAGVKIADFPFPIFLFGMLVAALIVWGRSPRRPHSLVALLIAGAYVVFVIAKTLQFGSDGPASVFAFLAWAGLPIIILALSTSITRVDPRYPRAFQWGFLVSVLFAGVQQIGGVERTAIPGLTYAFGDDLTHKHNVIGMDGAEEISKIPSTYQNGNIYGLAAAVFLIFALIRLFRHQGTKLDIVVAVGAMGAIGLSGSRTAIIAAAVPVLILILQRGSMRWRIGIIVIACAAASAVFALQPTLAQRYTLDAVLQSGGSGRVTIWQQSVGQMTTTDFIVGMGSRAVVPDGWIGLVIQLGIVGCALLVAAVVALTSMRREWWLILVVLLIGALIDSSYVTFPTWFIPAALLSARLTPRPQAAVVPSVELDPRFLKVVPVQ